MATVGEEHNMEIATVHTNQRKKPFWATSQQGPREECPSCKKTTALLAVAVPKEATP
ncbi:hypothetical protein QG37_08281 [Candidozyma auris]|uniref:Uncharacterized protein n=1 Tax=Candidozyma auris TaxID=498019 RepID=A0A0L0NN42_CANAR|nr:hypothetical protein QG37_08281 [[Candida] auris]